MSSARNSLHLLVHALGLVAVLTMLAVLVYEHNVRFDLTPQKIYTLSGHSKSILRQIDQDVQVRAFTRREDPRNDYLQDLLWRVSTENPRIRTQIIDLNRNPTLARQYGADAYGAVVVQSGEHRKRFSAVREEVLIAAILQVTRKSEKVVYFLTGHGERDPTNTDRNRGYSSAKTSLEHELYRVKTLSLASAGAVPGDAAAVVAAAPREDLLPEEFVALRSYLDRGGSLLALVDPDTSPTFPAFLRQYGVTLPEAVVADGDYRLASSELLTMRVPELSRTSLITATLDGDPVFSLARPVEKVGGSRDGSDIQPILETSSESWRVPAPRGEVPDDLEYRSGRDERGPFPLGLEVRIPLSGGEETEGDDPYLSELTHRSTRLVVYGDSDFANNFFIELLGNRDLLVNTVNWLALEESLIGVRPVRKELGREQFFVSNRQSYTALWLGAIIEPAIFLFVGVVIFVWRRFW